MKVLLDQNMPARLRRSLPGHLTMTALSMGWDLLDDGLLIGTAERAGFVAMITADQSIQYQEKRGERRLALVVLSTNDWTRISNHLEAIREALERCTTGSLEEIPVPPDTRMRK